MEFGRCILNTNSIGGHRTKAVVKLEARVLNLEAGRSKNP